MSTTEENPLGPPPWLNAPPVEAYPYEDTHDLRQGPDLHPALLGLLPFIGLWRGRGRGGYPTVEDFDYAQEIRISHDGRPFLHYESRAWLLDDQSQPIRQAGRETGWWRPVLADGRPTDEVEALMSSPTGIMELYVGRAVGTRLELVTDAVMRTATAKEVTAGQRLFGIVDGALLYAQEMAAEGHPLTPHLSARLVRAGGSPPATRRRVPASPGPDPCPGNPGRQKLWDVRSPGRRACGRSTRTPAGSPRPGRGPPPGRAATSSARADAVRPRSRAPR